MNGISEAELKPLDSLTSQLAGSRLRNAKYFADFFQGETVEIVQ
jgi:hypothetical protein